MNAPRLAALLLTLLPLPSLVVAQTPPPSQAPKDAYRINPGDEIEVYVWGEERLQRTIRILPDGTFSFPLVGRVDAENKLPVDIEAIITKGLAAQYRDQVPQVTVSIKTPAGYQFSVMGKVKAPGSYTPGRYVNVLEAIGLAGGPAEFAEVSNVTILRKQNDKLTAIHVRLTDALKGAPSSRDQAAGGLPQVVSGDTVIIP